MPISCVFVARAWVAVYVCILTAIQLGVPCLYSKGRHHQPRLQLTIPDISDPICPAQTRFELPFRSARDGRKHPIRAGMCWYSCSQLAGLRSAPAPGEAKGGLPALLRRLPDGVADMLLGGALSYPPRRLAALAQTLYCFQLTWEGPLVPQHIGSVGWAHCHPAAGGSGIVRALSASSQPTVDAGRNI